MRDLLLFSLLVLIITSILIAVIYRDLGAVMFAIGFSVVSAALVLDKRQTEKDREMEAEQSDYCSHSCSCSRD